jgi:hypothetical protein
MNHINDSAAAGRAKYEIEQALITASACELRAGERFVVALGRDGFEFSVEWGKLIFAWWGEGRAESWRVTDYEVGAAEVGLTATRGMGRETARFTLRDAAREVEAAAPLEELSADERRVRYGDLLAELIPQHFDGARVERLSVRGPRAGGEPGRYARLVLKLGTKTALAVGVNGGEAQSDVDDLLAAALVWLAHFNRDSGAGVRPRAQELWLCVPRGRGQTVGERLSFIRTEHLGAGVELFEVDEAGRAISAVRAFTQGELLNAHPRELKWPRAAGQSEWRERIVSLAPDLIEVREDLGGDAEAYSIHGLEFARVAGRSRDRATFGVAQRAERVGERASGRAGEFRGAATGRKKLSAGSIGELARLVREIVGHRRAGAADVRHPFYRLRAEAWLESLLRRDIRRLDASLDARYVYSQVPAWRADERSVIDLLAVNRDGRLVIIEIKAAEDPQLPLQGLDYWLRVEQARRRGDLERRGLFAGLRLADAPPLVYLVAPQLRFHRTFATVARCLAPEVEAYRVGVNANWRAGVRVRTMERVNLQSEK